MEADVRISGCESILVDVGQWKAMEVVENEKRAKMVSFSHTTSIV